MALHESGEDYLETIYLLSKKSPYVRSIDVANELGYSKPSVSRAMKILREEGMITVSDDGALKLTKAGMKHAAAVYERHMLFTQFFAEFLGVNPVTAEKDACKVEHIISDETYLRLKGYMTEHGYEPPKE